MTISCQVCGKNMATLVPSPVLDQDTIVQLKLDCYPKSGTHQLVVDFLRAVEVIAVPAPLAKTN